MDGAIMPDPWEEAAKSYKASAQPASAAVAPATAPSDDWKIWQQQSPQDTHRFSDFVGNFWNKINPGPLLLAMEQQVHGDPTSMSEIARAIVDAHAQEFRRAVKDWNSGSKGSAAMDVAFGAVPVIGPQMDAAAQQIERGDVAGGIGSMAGISFPWVASSPAFRSAAGRLAKSAGPVAKATGAAIQAGGKDVAKGGALLGAGVAGGVIAHEMGMPYVPYAVSGSTIWPAFKLIRGGLSKSAVAARETMANVRTQDAAAAQRAAGRTPGWEDVGEPTLQSPEALAPVAAELPSGRQPGSMATQQPLTTPPAPRNPTWQGVTQPSTTEVPPITPAQSELPSGRVPGSIANQTEAPVKPNVATAGDADLLEQIARGNFGRSFAKMKPAEQETVRTLADRVKSGQAAQAQPPQARPPAPKQDPIEISRQLNDAMGPQVAKPQPAAISAQEASNRTAMAKDLAQALHANGKGISAADASTMNDTQWDMVAQLVDNMRGVPAGMRRTAIPSAATRSEALQHLQELERVQSIKQQLRDTLYEPTLTSPETP